MRSGLGIWLGGAPGLGAQLISVLRKYGADAHLWLPGIGYVNGVDAGNYLDASFAETSYDNPVGLVRDAASQTVSAAQTTTAKKAILRQGLLNQVIYSGDLANDAYTKSVSTLATNGETTPLGSVGTTLTVTGDNGNLRWPSVSAPAGTKLTVYFEAALGANTTDVTMVDQDQGSACWARLNLSTGTITPTGLVQASSAVALGSGWWLFAVTYTVQTGKTSAQPTIWPGSWTTGGAGKSVKLGRVGLSWGQLTAAEILAFGAIPLTTTAPASLGSTYRRWEFDGTDDLFDLAPIPFLATDDYAAGVVFRNDRGIGTPATVFDISAVAGTPIVLRLESQAGGTVNAYSQDNAATLINLSYTPGAVGVPRVVSGYKRSGVRGLRVAGMERVTSSAVLGTTTVTTARLGATAITTPNNFLRGGLFAAWAIKGTVPDSDLLILDRVCGALAGVIV